MSSREYINDGELVNNSQLSTSCWDWAAAIAIGGQLSTGYHHHHLNHNRWVKSYQWTVDVEWATYGPSEGEGQDEPGMGSIRFQERERIATEDGAGIVAVGARARHSHVTLILLEAQTEESWTFTSTNVTTWTSRAVDVADVAAAAAAIGQSTRWILQLHNFQLEEAGRCHHLRFIQINQLNLFGPNQQCTVSFIQSFSSQSAFKKKKKKKKKKLHWLTVN